MMTTDGGLIVAVYRLSESSGSSDNFSMREPGSVMTDRKPARAAGKIGRGRGREKNFDFFADFWPARFFAPDLGCVSGSKISNAA